MCKNKKFILENTNKQKNSLKIYSFMAYFTGIFLLLLVIEMIAKYVFEYEFIIYNLNISKTILVIHGWGYIFYLIASFKIWILFNWNLKFLIKIILGGVIPVLSFFVEREIYRKTNSI